MTAETLSQETGPTDKPPYRVPVPMHVRSSTGFNRVVAWVLCIAGICIFSIGCYRLNRMINATQTKPAPRPRHYVEPLPGQLLVKLSDPSGLLKATRP